ncbi:MAG: hypothetical protein NC099_06265 [Corallococcus sp.]|nr:hypothetical protein [Bacillota bacterium]MCM1534237.1 hypothetical protein [Corallococcus sp.]
MANKRKCKVLNTVVSDGKKMGVVIETQKGETKTLLNPHGKTVKYRNELQSGVRLTNDGVLKRDSDGNYVGLTPTEAAFRSGYIAAQADNARAYNADEGGRK